ncbi:MAG: ECF transporter S component [Candidatus Helarchaeota archaeon]
MNAYKKLIINIEDSKNSTINPEIKKNFIVKKDNWIFNIVLIACLAALSIAISYILAFIPNIELMSFILFISGLIYGYYVGLGVGLISSLIFYGWNPWGVSDPITYITCVLCMSFIGFIGGFFKPKQRIKSNNNRNKINGNHRNNHINNKNQKKKLDYSAWNIYRFGFAGLLLTLFFDITTNVVMGIVFYFGRIDIALLNPGSLLFMIIHTVSNTIIFSILTIPVYNSIIAIKDYPKSSYMVKNYEKKSL